MHIQTTFIAAFILLSMTSCVKEPDSRIPGAFTIDARSEKSRTKGYVSGNSLTDTNPLGMYGDSAATSSRTIVVSSHLQPTETEAGKDYFCGETFSRSDDGLWRHDPEIYRPFGRDIILLAYSSGEPFTTSQAIWDEADCSSSLTLKVDASRLNDDILYAAGITEEDETSDAAALEFHHSQAWIHFEFAVPEISMENIMEIDSVVLNDIYAAGEFTVTNEDNVPVKEWSFAKSRGLNLKIPDTHGAYGTHTDTIPYAVANAVSRTVKYIDILIPEQEMKDIEMHYHLAGSQKNLCYRFSPDASGTWQAGLKYVYSVTIEATKISVTPSVTTWQVTSAANVSLQDAADTTSTGNTAKI